MEFQELPQTEQVQSYGISRPQACWRGRSTGYSGKRDLSERDCVHVGADGLHFQVRDCLTSLFGFSAEHWQHLGTANDMESPFATARLRQRVNRTLLVLFKPLDLAQKRWRRATAPLIVDPRAGEGAPFTNGTQIRNVA